MIRRLSLCAALLLGGCTVGPNYVPPQTAVPPAFVEPQPAVNGTADLATWWKAYKDPELDRLITIAVADNLDIKTAVSRIRQARTQEIQARAGGLPTIDASANVSHTEFSKNAGLSQLAQAFGGSTGGSGPQNGIGLPGDSITTYTTGFDASWEIDIFGGTRRAVEGARARTEAAVWNSRDAAVQITAEVANTYVQLRLAQQREAVARAEIARQQRSLSLLQHTAQAGLVPEGDSVRQRAQLATAEASIDPLIAEQHVQMHALAVLLGKSPDALMDELSPPPIDTPAPLAIPAGLPSDLLRRRPDIRAAERDLAGATADIGVAVADLYPKFNLTGAAQLISTSLAKLFTRDSLQLNGMAGITFPLLDWGRRHAKVDEQRAIADQAYLSYQKIVLSALRDVEDALIRIDTERQRNTTLRAGVRDADRAVAAVRARYDSGLVDLGPVLDAQQSALSDRDQLAQSDGMLKQDIASLYKALGGGWSDQTASSTLGTGTTGASGAAPR